MVTMHRKGYKVKLFLLTVLFLFFSGWLFNSVHASILNSEDSKNYRSANTHYLKAKKHFIKQKYPKAEKELRKCLSIMQEHDEANYLMAQVCYLKGDYDNAINYIEYAKVYFDFLHDIHISRTEKTIRELSRHRDKLVEAHEHYQIMLSEGKISGDMRGRVRSMLRDIEKEIILIDNILNTPLAEQKNPPAMYYLAHGNILSKQNNYADAQIQYLKAIKLKPMYEEAYNNLANIYYLTGKYENALEILQYTQNLGLKINEQFMKELEEKMNNP